MRNATAMGPGTELSTSSRFLTYQSLFTFISAITKSRTHSPALSVYHDTVSAADSISAIVNCRSSRKTLLQLATDFGISGDAGLRDALREDDKRLATSIVAILKSDSERAAILRLEGNSIQNFMDVVQDTLDKGLLLENEHNSKARRMILKLSEVCNKLPSSLFISGVTGRDEHALFGGGFGDIYQASYAGRTVAIKRIRTFHRDAAQRHIWLEFYREALVWQGLDHPSVLPLFGIDRETFQGSLCMVSPWMENGTVLKYLNDHGRADVDKLLFEIAQGLQYLHSRNIVHGDLRGANILITNEWSACLTDFGLASFSDATAATHTSRHRAGSLRWMAPELIDPDRFGRQFLRTPATDVFAFGCVCLELYTGQPPFTGLSEAAALLKVIDGRRPEQPCGEPTMSAALWDYVSECWAQESEKRPLSKIVVQRIPLPRMEVAQSLDTEPSRASASSPPLQKPQSPPRLVMPDNGDNSSPNFTPTTINTLETDDLGARMCIVPATPVKSPEPGNNFIGQIGSIESALDDRVPMNEGFRFDPAHGSPYRPAFDRHAAQLSKFSFGPPPGSVGPDSGFLSLLPGTGLPRLKLDARPSHSRMSRSDGISSGLTMYDAAGNSEFQFLSLVEPPPPFRGHIRSASWGGYARNERSGPGGGTSWSAASSQRPSPYPGRNFSSAANFICPVPGCGSTFAGSFNLKAHIRSHNEDKPFLCRWPGCGKGFATNHNCKRHEQLHTNYRPFPCEGCGKQFARMDALNRHLRSKGGAECRRTLEADGQMPDFSSVGGKNGGLIPNDDMGMGGDISAESYHAPDPPAPPQLRMQTIMEDPWANMKGVKL
ncbi:kinase-like domain-containing protein [Mycena alexandri]|uniref:Kinase-like domain-containing protein n=1 Tax=Mycena alexandri TaxID=1745969 RepID=A0AAD6WKL2_9AGAR|nr:kinase-like domain-containing protein [Mycena alexandri]